MHTMTCLHPDWPAPANVKSLVTTRSGGVSQAPFAALNLSTQVGDRPEDVATNRAILRQYLPAEPCWLQQVHGTTVVEASERLKPLPEADAITTRQRNTVCAIMTADCLPVLLTDRAGTIIGACHAGWRGLCNGVIEATVNAMQAGRTDLIAWLGPAIGADAFEVGQEVYDAFVTLYPQHKSAFTPIGSQKYLADIYQLARLRLSYVGVTQVFGGDYCTVIDREQFFSYRRDQRTGRLASLIWLDGL